VRTVIPVTTMPRKILIIAPSWIGDTIAAQPLFMRLEARYPGVTLDALAAPWVAPVLAAMPQIERVIPNPFAHGELQFKARMALGRSLRAYRYDEAIVLPNSWKSALVPFFAGIPVRTGFVGEARWGLINRPHRLDKLALPRQADRYAQLAEDPGTPPAQPLPFPQLTRRAQTIAATLATFDLAAAPAPAVLCPGAEYGPAKRWPPEYFAHLARMLADRGMPVWLIGGKQDAAIGDYIETLTEGAARNLCGKTDLSQAFDLISLARVAVTNDSGLMHVSAALGVPVVALFGSSSPAYTPPLSDQAVAMSLALPCSPCFKRTCPLKHTKCLNDLHPDRVIDKIDRLLSGQPTLSAA